MPIQSCALSIYFLNFNLFSFQVFIPVIEHHFWILVVANFNRQCFETYCPYYDGTAAAEMARVVITNFQLAYHEVYHSWPFSIYGMKIEPVQIVSDNSNE